MDTSFDYSKTYYKVVKENHNHNGFIYRKGLNVLNEPFNDDPNASCVRGRLYLTDYENLPVFLYHGDLIYEVTIPQGAMVVKDPDGDKWGTDRLVLGKCYRIVENFDKWFDKEKINYEIASSALATYCYEHFDKWFDNEKFKYDKDGSFALAARCYEHFDKWFDGEKFNFDDTYVVRMLKNNCSDYRHIWGKYVKY